MPDTPRESAARGNVSMQAMRSRSEIPTAVLNEITDWLSGRHPVVADAPRPPASQPSGDNPDGEESIVFGKDHPLFGILTRPPAKLLDPKRPAIIMTNAGCVHRIGPHRLYVPMARRWAALGFVRRKLDRMLMRRAGRIRPVVMAVRRQMNARGLRIAESLEVVAQIERHAPFAA